jgi:uncharacterized protein (TIGR02284 family)
METVESKKTQIDALQELLEKNYDAEKGYKQLMSKSESEPIKKWLLTKAVRRSQFATELDAQIRLLNGTPIESGSVTGTMHRTWIDVKSALTSNTDLALVEECQRGEQASCDEYKDQLTEINFDTKTTVLLFAQKEAIESAINTAERIEDIIK